MSQFLIFIVVLVIIILFAAKYLNGLEESKNNVVEIATNFKNTANSNCDAITEVVSKTIQKCEV